MATIDVLRAGAEELDIEFYSAVRRASATS
jgi:hypothetical protein